MESRTKKILTTISKETGEDRISALPDELIHKIYSFLDAKEAVQSSVLSKRWKLIWTTLPFLGFGRCDSLPFNDISRYTMFIRHVLSNRNHESNLSELKMYVPRKLTVKQSVCRKRFRGCVVEKFIEYAISHNVQELNIRTKCRISKIKPFKLSTFNSKSMKKLTLDLLLDEDFALESNCWDLPALTTLHLKHAFSWYNGVKPNLPESSLTSLPALRTLCLDYANLSEISLSLPNLKTLRLSNCKLPRRVEAPELEDVNIKLKGWLGYVPREKMKRYYQQFTCMLSGLGTAKNLSFDLESIEALSEIINIQARVSSPFINLKYVKLPKEYRNSSLSSALRSYLLGGCRGATIVTTSALQNNRILRTRAVSVAAGNVVQQKPLAAPTKELDDCQYKNKTVTVDTVDMGVQEQHVMENSLVDANRAGQTNPLVGGVSNDQGSSKGNSHFGLWQGHEVNSDFVCLLTRIMHKYPETFEHFTTKNKKISTVRLNMLCTSLNDFNKVSMAEVDSEIIVQYRDIFAYLQSLGFNLSWVMSHLDYIEHLWLSNPLITEIQAVDCRIDDAKSEVKDLQASSAEKMTEIEKKIGTSVTNLAVGFIGDDLLYGP
ncbi:hypothetical protein AgCh_006494 [Apium graveolens]